MRSALSHLPAVTAIARLYGDATTDPYVRLLLDLERRANADPLNAALQETFAQQLAEYSSNAFLRRYEAGYFPRTPTMRALYTAARAQQFGGLRSGVPPTLAHAPWAQALAARAPTADAAALVTRASDVAASPAAVPATTGARRMPFSVVGALTSLSMLATMVLLVLLIGAMLRPRGVGGGGDSFSEVSPEDCKVGFADVKGCDEARAEAEELVEFLKNPKKFNSMGAEIPRGLLLTGPPGTGKTLLAKAVAGEAGVPFFFISGSSFDEMFVGTGAKKVRELFAAAKAKAPCIIFIDEIDAVGGARSKKQESYHRQTLNALLVEMDGFEPNDGVIVMGATNLSDALDKALLRPGRFDRQLVLDLPDVRGRKQILDHYIAKTRPAGDVDTSVLARATPGASGAMLKSLVNSAAILATQLGRETVSMSELEHAKDKMLMGAARVTAIIPEPVRRKTAYHEGGHAICALFTEGAMPIYKATIMPRGNALGMVMQLPEDDVVSMTKKEMLARLDVCMGGRVAEEVIYGMDNVSSGASGDF